MNAQKDFLLVQTVELVQIQFKDLVMPCIDEVSGMKKILFVSINPSC